MHCFQSSLLILSEYKSRLIKHKTSSEEESSLFLLLASFPFDDRLFGCGLTLSLLLLFLFYLLLLISILFRNVRIAYFHVRSVTVVF